MPHSSRGPGHRPLKAEITGSNPVCGTTPSPRPRSVLKSSRYRLGWRTRAPLSAPLCVWFPPGLGSQTMTRGTRCGVRQSPAPRCRGGAADQPLAQITRSHASSTTGSVIRAISQDVHHERSTASHDTIPARLRRASHTGSYHSLLTPGQGRSHAVGKVLKDRADGRGVVGHGNAGSGVEDEDPAFPGR